MKLKEVYYVSNEQFEELEENNPYVANDATDRNRSRDSSCSALIVCAFSMGWKNYSPNGQKSVL